MTMTVSTTLAAARTKALRRKIHSGALVDGFAGRSRWPDMGTKMAEIGEATEDRKTAVATSTAQMTPRGAADSHEPHAGHRGKKQDVATWRDLLCMEASGDDRRHGEQTERGFEPAGSDEVDPDEFEVDP